MSGTNPSWLALSLLAAVIVLAALSYLAIFLVYRLAGRAMAAQHKAQEDLSSIVSELLAHRTLADTGNLHLAGSILQHSDLHDHRRMPPIHIPEPPEEPMPRAGNESPTFEMTDDLIPQEPARET